MKQFLIAWTIVGLAAAGAHAETQAAPPVGHGGLINGMECPVLDTPPPSAVAPEAPSSGQAVLASGSTATVTVDEAVSSARFQRGMCFSISLAEPIVVDGQVVAQAGAVGVGQVVDSRRGGLGGTPGMLILAARYLMVDGQRIPLRGFRIIGSARDYTAGIVTAGAVAGAFVPFAGMATLLIPGGDLTVPAGYRAEARVRAPVLLSTLGPAPAGTGAGSATSAQPPPPARPAARPSSSDP
jgi:hypothetical protein